MVRFVSVFALIAGVVSSGALAHERRFPVPAFPVAGTCQYGTSSDSYGLGIAIAFEAPHYTATEKFAFEPCRGIGMRVALAALSNESAGFGDARCKSDFRDGFSHGMQVDGISLGVACYHLGYQAGYATLRTAARNQLRGLATDGVLRAYRAGATDAASRRASLPPTSPAAEREAYLAGYWDGSGF